MEHSFSDKNLNDVYDLLVDIGGANESERLSFIHAHLNSECKEWRFQGKLGFGGKYRIERNKIDCYPEDETNERLWIIEVINRKLSDIKNQPPA